MDLACAELYARNHRRIGFCISSRLDERVSHAWLAEFGVWSRSTGMGVEPFIDLNGNVDTFNKWLREYLPDALLSLETWIYGPLLENYNAASGSKIKIFSLGYHAARPEIGGVDQQSRRVASAAVDLIVAQLHRNEHGIPPYPQTVLIEGIWKEE